MNSGLCNCAKLQGHFSQNQKVLKDAIDCLEISLILFAAYLQISNTFEKVSRFSRELCFGLKWLTLEKMAYFQKLANFQD